MFDGILCDGGSDSVKPNLLDSGPDLHAMQRVCSSLTLDGLVFVADPGEGDGAAPNLMSSSMDLHPTQRVCSDLELGCVKELECQHGDTEPVSNSGDYVDREDEIIFNESPQEFSDTHRVHEQEHVLRDSAPVDGRKGPISGDVHARQGVSCHLTESPEAIDNNPIVHEQAHGDRFPDVGQNVGMHAIERVCGDVIKLPEFLDETTIVQEHALRDETPVVGQQGPSDGDVHAVERVSCHSMEPPDVMNYHTGVPDAMDSRSLRDADPQIRQFDWTEPVGVSLMVPIGFEDNKVAAVIDSAAQVSVISPELRERLGWKYGAWDTRVTLRNAQKNSSMESVLWKNVGFRMGGWKYFCDFVEADINDSLILGIDFLRKYSCKVDFGRSVVEMSNGEEVFASYHRQDSGSFHIICVLANKKVSIKPRTAKRIKAKFEYPVDAPFAMKPTSRKDLFAPSIVVNGAQSVEILVMNLSDHHITLKRNSLLGIATEIDAMLVARDDREEGGPVADLYVCKSQGPPAPPELKVCAVSL